MIYANGTSGTPGMAGTLSEFPGYPYLLNPLPESGGGWFITFPDLPGCVSDGATPDEAIANGRDALQSWLRTAREFGDPVPAGSAKS